MNVRRETAGLELYQSGFKTSWPQPTKVMVVVGNPAHAPDCAHRWGDHNFAMATQQLIAIYIRKKRAYAAMNGKIRFLCERRFLFAPEVTWEVVGVGLRILRWWVVGQVFFFTILIRIANSCDIHTKHNIYILVFVSGCRNVYCGYHTCVVSRDVSCICITISALYI